MIFASSKVVNISIPKSSSSSLPLKDSTYAFCQGDPGSMKLMFEGLNRHQSATALLVISVPLSIRTNSGAMNVDESIQDCDNVIPAHGSFHSNGEYFFAELIGDVQVLQDPAITGLIELEIQRLHAIRTRSA